MHNSFPTAKAGQHTVSFTFDKWTVSGLEDMHAQIQICFKFFFKKEGTGKGSCQPKHVVMCDMT